MSIKINLGEWNGIFAVPNAVIDKHIKLASGAQLKVLLYILRHSGEELTYENISEAINISRDDIEDSIGFWGTAGLITEDNGQLTPGKKEQTATNATLSASKASQETKSRPVTRAHKPDSAFVASRISSDQEIAFLMQEAELILARPLSSGDSATLVLMHDSDGLPADVILMIMQFACSKGKGMKYIEALGAQWSAQGINTLEKAEEKIRSINQCNEAWKIVESTFGLDHHSPTAKEKENAERWIVQWEFSKEMIREAYEICVNLKGKYLASYVNKILEKWQICGIKTLDQARSQSKDSQSTNKRTSGMSGEPSYDIADFENTSMFDD